jgi:hypothetical protein
MSTFAERIDQLIRDVKTLPNGLNRNKITSHLEDAKAHAQALELYDLRSGNPNIAVGVKRAAERLERTGYATTLPQRTMACSCPDDGVIDKLCPTHGDVPSY